jgi:hypothetical protein
MFIPKLSLFLLGASLLTRNTWYVILYLEIIRSNSFGKGGKTYVEEKHT